MAEYFGRYTHTTKYLNSLGYHVVGIDHRGHGHWIESGATPGFFAKENGWDLVVDDMETSFKKIQTVYEDIPHIILAHSYKSKSPPTARIDLPSKVILSTCKLLVGEN